MPRWIVGGASSITLHLAFVTATVALLRGAEVPQPPLIIDLAAVSVADGASGTRGAEPPPKAPPVARTQLAAPRRAPTRVPAPPPAAEPLRTASAVKPPVPAPAADDAADKTPDV